MLTAAAAILGLVILAPALLSFGGPSASGLSPQLAYAPPGLVPIALTAGAATGIDLRGALAMDGGGTAYADRILALTSSRIRGHVSPSRVRWPTSTKRKSR